MYIRVFRKNGRDSLRTYKTTNSRQDTVDIMVTENNKEQVIEKIHEEWFEFVNAIEEKHQAEEAEIERQMVILGKQRDKIYANITDLENQELRRLVSTFKDTHPEYLI